MKAHKKSPPCSEHDGDRHLNHYEKVLFCIIQQDGLEIKEDIMPRGWKPKPTEAEKLEAAKKNVADIIDHAKIDQGIKFDKDVAEMIGLSRGTFAAKKKSGTWSFEDLYRLRSALKLSAETAAKMLGA